MKEDWKVPPQFWEKIWQSKICEGTCRGRIWRLPFTHSFTTEMRTVNTKTPGKTKVRKVFLEGKVHSALGPPTREGHGLVGVRPEEDREGDHSVGAPLL